MDNVRLPFEELKDLVQRTGRQLPEVSTLSELSNLYAQVLGSSSKLADCVRNLRWLDEELRPEAGRNLNAIKQELKQMLDERQAQLEEIEAQKAGLVNEDVTLPVSRANQRGKLHPVTQITMELHEIMAVLGFDFAEGPDIENDYYNFSALNIPSHHPARQMMATTYLMKHDLLLRTHTSPVQIHWMEKHRPPYRVYSCGRVFRNDYDQSHTPMFHQLEGLVVDRKTGLSDLRTMLELVLRTLFANEKLSLRFRPSYFPFTCPSAEVDIKIGDEWLEVIGCGMVHPEVLNNLKIDPELYQGYAWGFGLDRLAMIKFGLTDLRKLFNRGTQWVKAHGFDPLDVSSYAGGF